jgi:DNA-binding MarR family transcriptional regulator
MSKADYKPLVQISFSPEEERYRLAKLTMEQANEADCYFSFVYALLLKKQIEDAWYNRAAVAAVS